MARRASGPSSRGGNPLPFLIGLSAVLLGAAWPLPVRAAIIQYANRAAWNAAFPASPLEDFEEARVANNATGLMSGPLDSTTNNTIFHTNEIINGLRLNVPNTVSNPQNLFVSGAGFANYVSHAISFNDGATPAPQITIDLYNGNNPAIALDVTSNPNGNSITIAAFSGVTPLGTFVVANAQGSGTFFGISSNTQPITQLRLTDGSFYGVDNVAIAVPEPAAGALAALLLAAVGIPGRRRSRAPHAAR
jgi:hypothetical protein